MALKVVFSFSIIRVWKNSSTNSVERLEQEIQRRGRATGTILSQEADMRFITIDLIEMQEEWIDEQRSDIKPEHLETVIFRYIEER